MSQANSRKNGTRAVIRLRSQPGNTRKSDSSAAGEEAQACVESRLPPGMLAGATCEGL